MNPLITLEQRMGKIPVVGGRYSPFALVALTWLLLISLIPIWGGSQNLGALNDDTYITLTYAKSLAAGEGWRYNGGPEALGTTTPLFALTVALLGRLLPVLSLEQIAVGFSLICWLGTAWWLYLGRQQFALSKPAAVILPTVILLQGEWWYRTLGMEATFLLFGLTTATWLTAARRPIAAGLVAGLLFMIRPEGLAFIPLAALWLLWQSEAPWRQTITRFALGAAVPLLLWSGYAWVTFGTILPNSAAARIGQGNHWPGDPFIYNLVVRWLPPYGDRYGFSPVLSMLWPLVTLGLLHAARRSRSLLLLAGWTALFLLGYHLLQAPGNWWYMLPVLLLLQLFAALGLANLLQARSLPLRAVAIALTLLFGGLTLHSNIQSVQRGIADPRASTYHTIAGWLTNHTAPSNSVAFVEIGYLGFFSENRIIDLVGLVQPEFTENGTRLELARNFWEADADYFIYHPHWGWLMGEIVADERFTRQYRPVTELPGRHSTPIVIYERYRE